MSRGTMVLCKSGYNAAFDNCVEGCGFESCSAHNWKTLPGHSAVMGN